MKRVVWPSPLDYTGIALAKPSLRLIPVRVGCGHSLWHSTGTAGFTRLPARSRRVKPALHLRCPEQLPHSLGSSSDDVLKVLAKQGITRTLAKEALEVARWHGAMTKPRVATMFAVVDALTRISGKLASAGERSGPESVGTPVAGQVAIKVQRPRTTGPLLYLPSQRSSSDRLRFARILRVSA